MKKWEKDQRTSYTQKYQKHVLCGSCLYAVSSDEIFLQPPPVKHSPDAAQMLLDQVMATETTIRQYLKKKILEEKLTQQ